MFKKLSLILTTVSLCANMGIVLPVSAETETETVSNVIAESNFENCNLGTYSAANQTVDGVDLRGDLIMADEAALSTGFTLKNAETGEYDPISEVDVVEDGGVKVLRLNTFLTTYFDNSNATYPTLQTNVGIPRDGGKIKVDLEIKMSHPGKFWMYQSTPIGGGDFGIWRFEHHNSSYSKIKVLYNTDTGHTFLYDQYNTLSVIIDPVTKEMTFFKNGTYIYKVTGAKTFWETFELFLRPGALMDAAVAPTPTFNDDDPTKIEALAAKPQFTYIKSLKVTEYANTALESVSPANESNVATPTEAVFTFNNAVTAVTSAKVMNWSTGDENDVTGSISIAGNKVTVPYAFVDDGDYEVTLTGVTDGATSTDASTAFTTGAWNYSNLVDPLAALPGDSNTYLVNEDFTESTSTSRETIILSKNTSNGWYLEAPATAGTASIEELADGNKVFQVAVPDDQAITQIQTVNSNTLDDTSVLSFDLFIEEGTTSLEISRQVAGGRIPLGNWFKGTWNETRTMTAGEWHKVVVEIKNTKSLLYVDGNFVIELPATDAQALSGTKWLRLTTTAGTVKVDNLKIYLDNNSTSITDVAPAFDGTIKASTPLEFTYSEVIGDVTNAQLIVKKDNATETITNGNGMSVKVKNNTVKLILDDALDANGQYAVELSGLKDTRGADVAAVRTRFTTVADDEWMVADIDDVLTAEANVKSYTVKLKHQGAAENAQLIVATYNADGTLSAVALGTVTSVGEDWTDLNVARAEFFQAKSTKLYVWDAVAGMSPALNVISK